MNVLEIPAEERRNSLEPVAGLFIISHGAERKQLEPLE